MLFFSKDQLERHLYHPLWQSFYLIVLVLVLTLTLSLGIWWGWQKYFVPAEFAEFLPAADTVLLAQLDLNPLRPQSHALKQFITEHTELQLTTILPPFQLLAEEHALDFKTDLASWLGYRSVLAILKENDNFRTLLLLQVADQGLLQKKFEQFASPEEYQNFLAGETSTLQLGSQQIYSKLRKNYLAISLSPEPLAQILPSNKQAESLAVDPDWLKLQQIAPPSALQIYAKNGTSYRFLMGNEDLNKARKLFVSYLDKLGPSLLSLAFSDQTLKIKNSTLPPVALNPSLQAFSPSLLTFVNTTDQAFLSGLDLGQKLKTTLLNLTAQKVALGIPLQVLNENWLKRFDLNLSENLLPYFKGEYLWISGQSSEQNRLILKLPTSEQSLLLEKIKEAFQAYLPYLNPRYETRSLPDGSTYQELVAGASTPLELKELEIFGHPAFSYRTTGSDFALYYYQTPQALVLATKQAGLESFLDEQALPLSLPNSSADSAEISLFSLKTLTAEDSTYLPAKLQNWLSALGKSDLLLEQSSNWEIISNTLTFFDRAS